MRIAIVENDSADLKALERRLALLEQQYHFNLVIRSFFSIRAFQGILVVKTAEYNILTDAEPRHSGCLGSAFSIFPERTISSYSPAAVISASLRVCFCA